MFLHISVFYGCKHEVYVKDHKICNKGTRRKPMNVFIVPLLLTLNRYLPNSFLVVFLRELVEDICIVIGKILA